MRHFDAIRYITEVRSYYQNLMAKNKNLARVDEEGQNAIREMGYFINTLKHDLFRVENLINLVVEGLFESEHQRFKSKEQPLLSNVQPKDLYNFYDEFLYSKKDLTSLIKLMIIESLTQNGIIGYQKLKREILNIFGFQKIFLFRDLEALGWVKERESKKIKNLKNLTELNYAQILEKLELINEDYNPQVVNECSYVLNGFCPISLKIIEKAIMGKWGTIIDILKKIPGETSYPENETVISNPTN
jgi:hypothetical protein